jgi:ribosomal protein S18 acetylase RimI-like enzyme
VRHLNEYQFRTHPIGEDPSGIDSTPDTWRTDIIKKGPVVWPDMPQGGRRVGHLTWEKGFPTGQILVVEVAPEHQRRGLATEALRHSQRIARASGGRITIPVHASDRTHEGDAWAQSTGDYVPPNTMPHHMR